MSSYRSKWIVGLIILAVAAYGCSRIGAPDSAFNGKGVTPTPGFVLADDHIGTIVKATKEEEIGRKLTFTGLSSHQPKVICEGTDTFLLEKLFESKEKISLVYVSSTTGGVDVFVIDKKSGLFSRAFAGSFAGVYSGSEIGVLK